MMHRFFGQCCGGLPSHLTADSSVFTPNGASIGISFDTFGKTFLFVGKLSGSDKNVLCVSDWSKSRNNDAQQSTFLEKIKNQGINTEQFTLVNILEIPYKTSYVISSSQEIVAMIKLIQENNIDTKELSQLKLEHEALLSSSKPMKK